MWQTGSSIVLSAPDSGPEHLSIKFAHCTIKFAHRPVKFAHRGPRPTSQPAHALIPIGPSVQTGLVFATLTRFF